MWDDPRSTRNDRPAPAGPRRAPRRHLLREDRSHHDDDGYSEALPRGATGPGGPPRLTLPSQPALARVDPASTSSGSGRRGLGGRVGARLPLRRRSADSWEEYAESDDEWDAPAWDEVADAPGASGARSRERTAARPITAEQRTLASGRHRAILHAQPVEPSKALVPAAPPALPTDSVPDLVAYHPRPSLLARVPVHTRAVIQRASQPWSIARMVGVVAMILLAVAVSLSAAGEGTQPLLDLQAFAGGTDVAPVVVNVSPITQLIRCDEYDSYQQCQEYGDAACSAAAMTEVLTAWGVPNVTIGRVIDELGNDISPSGGLLTYAGFERVAAKHGFRADVSRNLTYNQILYIADKLGWPVIVDVRISYGYYYFFAGGHFLTVTGGNANGLSIADSSEYYIHSLPRDVFYSMFTGWTIVLVPQAMQYSLPNS